MYTSRRAVAATCNTHFAAIYVAITMQTTNRATDFVLVSPPRPSRSPFSSCASPVPKANPKTVQHHNGQCATIARARAFVPSAIAFERHLYSILSIIQKTFDVVYW